MSLRKHHYKQSYQSILKEISPQCSLEGLMSKLKLQYFDHLIRRADSFEKTLMLGKIEGRRRRGQQRMRWLDVITDSMDMSMSKFQEIAEDRKAWHTAVHRLTNSRTQLTEQQQSLVTSFQCTVWTGGLPSQQVYLADTIHQPWDQKAKVKVTQ